MQIATPPLDERRLLRLSGAHNVRDMGGYRSSFGGTVRWGRVFRAGRLDATSREVFLRDLYVNARSGKHTNCDPNDSCKGTKPELKAVKDPQKA